MHPKPYEVLPESLASAGACAFAAAAASAAAAGAALPAAAADPDRKSVNIFICVD